MPFKCKPKTRWFTSILFWTVGLAEFSQVFPIEVRSLQPQFSELITSTTRSPVVELKSVIARSHWPVAMNPWNTSIAMNIRFIMFKIKCLRF